MSQNGGITWSGRAVRWMFWRAPKSAVQYTYRSNLALASDLGRRWIVFAVFGAWLWAFRWVTVHVVPPWRVVSAVLLLVWFWHGLNLVRWTIHARAGASRARALAREDHQILQELRGDIRQAVSSAASHIPGGGHTIVSMLRRDDPVRDEHERIAKEQAEQVRQWTGADIPMGDKFEPLIAWPRFLRRSRNRDDGE